jgi:hypothetical protein
MQGCLSQVLDHDVGPGSRMIVIGCVALVTLGIAGVLLAIRIMGVDEAEVHIKVIGFKFRATRKE